MDVHVRCRIENCAGIARILDRDSFFFETQFNPIYECVHCKISWDDELLQLNKPLPESSCKKCNLVLPVEYLLPKIGNPVLKTPSVVNTQVQSEMFPNFKPNVDREIDFHCYPTFRDRFYSNGHLAGVCDLAVQKFGFPVERNYNDIVISGEKVHTRYSALKFNNSKIKIRAVVCFERFKEDKMKNLLKIMKEQAKELELNAEYFPVLFGKDDQYKTIVIKEIQQHQPNVLIFFLSNLTRTHVMNGLKRDFGSKFESQFVSLKWLSFQKDSWYKYLRVYHGNEKVRWKKSKDELQKFHDVFVYAFPNEKDDIKITEEKSALSVIMYNLNLMLHKKLYDRVRKIDVKALSFELKRNIEKREKRQDELRSKLKFLEEMIESLKHQIKEINNEGSYLEKDNLRDRDELDRL